MDRLYVYRVCGNGCIIKTCVITYNTNMFGSKSEQLCLFLRVSLKYILINHHNGGNAICFYYFTGKRKREKLARTGICGVRI